MEEELVNFLKRRKLSFYTTLYTVLGELGNQGMDDLLQGLQQAIMDFNLDGRNRTSTLLALLSEQEE